MVDVGGDLLLVDCGAGAAHRLAEAGHDGRALRRIFITHLHSDHITGIPDLLWGGWVARWWQVPPVIVGPPGTADFVSKLLDAFSYDIRVRSAHGWKEENLRPEVREVEEGWTEKGAEWTVRAFRVAHEPVDEAFGYRVDADNASLGISGDTRVSENLVRHTQGVDLLLHEVISRRGYLARAEAEARAGRTVELARGVLNYHTPSDEVGGVAARAGAKRLVLSHLVLAASTVEQLAVDARVGYEGPLTVGDDLASFEVGGKS